MSRAQTTRNETGIDSKTVQGFGHEWQRFRQGGQAAADAAFFFERYFREFPWSSLTATSVGFDLGCGSGRWARLLAPRVRRVVCLDASSRALAIARGNLERLPASFLVADGARLPLRDASLDFGYSLGVLHHTLDPLGCLRACAAALKPGAPFLVYLYYALEFRPWWYRALWRVTDGVRQVLSRIPFWARCRITDLIALTVYLPLARLARLAARMSVDPEALPLGAYARSSFYTMRTDALDRLGTRIERRFSRDVVLAMMREAGFVDVRLWGPPFWCAVGTRARSTGCRR